MNDKILSSIVGTLATMRQERRFADAYDLIRETLSAAASDGFTEKCDSTKQCP